MNCPKCHQALKQTVRHGLEVDQCEKCRGFWLDSMELDALEDKSFDLDGLKGSLIFKNIETGYLCPHCEGKLKSFQYRLYDLTLEYCEQEHGYWLDEGEDQRVLELMKKRESQMNQKFTAEDKWASTLKRFKSKLFLRQIKDFFVKKNSR